ncbi:DNA primase [Dinghuibacter silviterrae]|uniref:DNA primase n=1 Tax=Dinghuibacter silviterrae TaxID=1539049 RepID=A0A4R8DUP5_9BACT|nr:DNA primase [Dinghuibacter silviterrae]TDX01666.1 DNA primase [Dinghuibacter silviterrae]
MITQETIQQIQNRIDILDVVGEFVKLKKRGANYLGLCPFHNEKTPSFTVSPAKEIYKCFGCGRSGNTIGFLMEHEKYSYVEALRWLANRYGIEVAETETSPEYQQRQQVSESLFILNQYAQKYFSKTLEETEEGQAVGMSYLEERGFRADIIRKFQLGYCMESRDAFSKTAVAAQFNPELLQRSGLSVLRNEQLYDNYRGRIIFPVHNPSGKILGFGARQIRTNDRSPKYINTPENEIYVKSKLLYGLYFARQAIDRQDECLLVEGYTDVISLHQAGVENVVASGGTSLTQDQLRLIKKYTDNLTIVYDGDAAGIKAALRGLDMALEERLQVSLVLIPDKEDPDSYVRKVGPERFREFVVANKKDFVFFQLDVALKDAGDDPRKKAAVVNQIAETLARINKAEDFTRQQDYIRRSSELLKIDEAGLNALVNKHIREKVGKLEARQASEPSAVAPEAPAAGDADAFDLLNKEEANERALIRCLLEYGSKHLDEDGAVAEFIFAHFDDAELFDNKDLFHVLHLYKELYRSGAQPDMRTFLYHQDPGVSSLVIGLTDTNHQLSDRWHTRDADLNYNTIKDGYLKYLGKDYVVKEEAADQERYKEEVRSTVTYMQLKKIKKMMRENQKDMEKPHTPDELTLLKETHRHLKDLEIELTRRLGTVILK